MPSSSSVGGASSYYSDSHKLSVRIRNVYDKLFFGVLYAMVHGNTFSRKFIVLNIVVEFIRIPFVVVVACGSSLISDRTSFLLF